MESSGSVPERSGGGTSVERLMAAIGYPERTPRGSVSFTLRVDGAEVFAEEAGGRLVLSHALADDAALLHPLAAYAAGRMLMEDATLAYGVLPASGAPGLRAFLWQDAPADADSRAMLRLFESFMDSCDWWRARVAALREEGEAAEEPATETMMIRP